MIVIFALYGIWFRAASVWRDAKQFSERPK